MAPPRARAGIVWILGAVRISRILRIPRIVWILWIVWIVWILWIVWSGVLAILVPRSSFLGGYFVPICYDRLSINPVTVGVPWNFGQNLGLYSVPLSDQYFFMKNILKKSTDVVLMGVRGIILGICWVFSVDCMSGLWDKGDGQCMVHWCSNLSFGDSNHDNQNQPTRNHYRQR